METKTEETTKVNPLDKYRDRYKDRNLESDDDFHSALSEDFDNLEDYRSRNVEANRKLADLFETEPELLAVVRDMSNGATFREALAANVDLDDLQAQEGDADYDGYQANVKKRQERIAANSKVAEEMEANQAQSVKEIEEFAEENKLDKDQVGELLNLVDSLIGDIAKGKITKKSLNIIKRHLDFDSETENQYQAGRLDGRNEKIETIKDKENTLGDGLPAMNAGGAEGAGKKQALTALGVDSGASPLDKLNLGTKK